ncbi:Inner membrane protein YrbG, predicted calcium/sodium:proton antiporter [hydrothermal vent metagenome]|uniref:Inner membrane protein YrbG, predicted calcium/sodium:proton antiporter n=1 Tax=hydrothermal vent metagenome TaxID=652676 RepID=A0A3B0SXI1_9ZZZZ
MQKGVGHHLYGHAGLLELDFLMPTLLPILWLVFGIAILIVSGDVLVRGSASLAKGWGIPPLIIGLTVIALGTSAPELVVSVGAVLAGAPGLAVGNVIGSNTANMLLVLGVPAMILPITTTAPGTRRNVAIAIAAAVIFFLMALGGSIGFWQGVLLFSLIVIYLLYLFTQARSGKEVAADIAEMSDVDHMDGLPKRNLSIAIFILIGMIGLPIGGHLVGSNAVTIAANLGISDAIIGLTIVAIGTSLPELATSVIAAFRGHSELAVGNAFGSNIFNIFAVGGAAAMTGTLPIDPALLQLDLPVMLGASILLALFVFARKSIGRVSGFLLAFSYLAYLAYLVYTVA